MAGISGLRFRLPLRLTGLPRVPPLLVALVGVGAMALVGEVLILTNRAWAGVVTGSAAIGGAFLAYLVWQRRAQQEQQIAAAERTCRRQERQLKALQAISAALNLSADLDTMIREALLQVLDIMQLDAGDVRLIQDGQLVLKAAHAVSPDFVAAERVIPLGFCHCGRAAQAGRVLVVEDLTAPAMAQTPCACEQFGAVLSVPVQTSERVVGLLHAVSYTPRTFDAADRELLAAIGHQIGVAVERAQFHGQLLALNAALEERVAERTRELEAARAALAQQADALRQILLAERRIEEQTRAHIAHDLHDGVQQIIIGALFETQAARDLLTTQPDLAGVKLAEAQQLLRCIETEMRRAIFNLRPVALDAHGLAPALRECVAGFNQAGQIPCALRVSGVPQRLNPDAEVAAFRIVQEALNNLAVHSHATHAAVTVHFAPQQVAIEVSDNGIGFDLAAINQEVRSHLGLIGMRERAESVGGVLTIASRPGGGTRVLLVLPLAAGGQDGDESHEADPSGAGG